MGLMNAMGIAETDLTIEQQLAWHFSSNCYPPIPKIMIPVAIEAIDAAWEEDWNKEIAMPEGVSYKGLTTAPAWAIIDQHHLDAWIEHEDY